MIKLVEASASIAKMHIMIPANIVTCMGTFVELRTLVIQAVKEGRNEGMTKRSVFVHN